MGLVRRAFEAASRRPPDWETINAVFDREHEFVNRLDTIEGGASVGAAGWQNFMARMDEAGDWSSEVVSCHAAPDGRVVALTRSTLRGKRSGVAVEDRPGAVVTLEHGRIKRTEVFASWQEALEAAGLEE